MSHNKIIRVKTENSYELKTLFDVLKESLQEVNITFIRDSDQIDSKKAPNKKPEKKIAKKKVSESLSEKPSEKTSESGDGEKCDLEDLVKKEGEESESDDTDEENSAETESDEDSSESSESEEETTKSALQKKNPGGIRIIALDEHQTLMIYVKLNSSNFVEYYARHPKLNVGLDLRELYKFMKGIDKDSIMTISVDKDDDQKIEFHLQNPDKNTNTVYKQKMMDLDDNAARIPQETKFEMAVSMDTQDFRKICTEMSQFNEYVEIICTNKEIIFKCLGDQNELVRTFKHGEKGVKISCVENKKKPTVVQAIYSLKYLLTFGKCVNLCNDIQLYLKNDYPLFIHYTVGNLGKMLVGLTPTDSERVRA